MEEAREEHEQCADKKNVLPKRRQDHGRARRRGDGGVEKNDAGEVGHRKGEGDEEHGRVELGHRAAGGGSLQETEEPLENRGAADGDAEGHHARLRELGRHGCLAGREGTAAFSGTK